ncbi:MAG: PilZ domain-containing protein [Myxococcus sp.]|nr:PilZ domain-containing protein [Myxococcus sp.]
MVTPTHHKLQLLVGAPEDLLPRFYPNGKQGGLSVDGNWPGALGEFVTLTVRVRRPPREFVFAGQVSWARRKGSRQLHECFGIDFQPDDDATIGRMLAFARNEVPAETTRHEGRVQVELPIKLLHGKTSRRERLADLSHGGAFVRTWDPLDVDELVELVVRPPSSLFSLHLKGRVAWVRRVGDASGMGIEFFDLEGSLRRDVDRLLGHAR